jgi:hypothetical protein
MHWMSLCVVAAVNADAVGARAATAQQSKFLEYILSNKESDVKDACSGFIKFGKGIWPTMQCDIIWVHQMRSETSKFVMVASTSDLADKSVLTEELVAEAYRSAAPVFPKETDK